MQSHTMQSNRDSLQLRRRVRKNIFAGRILEIEGLEDLKCEQAFEANRRISREKCCSCTVKLNKEPIIEYLESNIVLIEEAN